MENIKVDLEKLIKLRQDKDFSISYVSLKIGYKTPTGYWLIEKGERKVNIQILYKLSKLYSLKMEDLLVIQD